MKLDAQTCDYKSIIAECYYTEIIGYCIQAIRDNNLDLLKTCCDKLKLDGDEMHMDVIDVAIIYNRLHFLNYLQDIDECPMCEEYCALAAKHGHIDILKWLRHNNCPWNRDTCSDASEYGHLELLKWARDNGCPWDKTCCNLAARRGHIEVLKYLVANGCGPDPSTMRYALEDGHLDIVHWLSNYKHDIESIYFNTLYDQALHILILNKCYFRMKQFDLADIPKKLIFIPFMNMIDQSVNQGLDCLPQELRNLIKCYM